MRDYDPTTGRYMQADPLGLVDGASVYGYARQNPGRWTDPRGLFTLSDARDSLILSQPSYSHRSYWPNSELFDEWLRLERAKREWLKELPECPCEIDAASGDGWYPMAPANSEHPGGVWEVRSWPTAGSHASQCVYNGAGRLMTNIPAAGTADYRYFSRLNPLTYIPHLTHDLQPWYMAKELGRESDYYDVRPVQ